MDEKHLHSIKGGHITADMLLAYRKGTLPERERLRIERAMADDPFLTDAVEGLQEADPAAIEAALTTLNRDIDVITGQKKVFRISPAFKKYASAAMILVFFGLTLLIMNRLNKDAAQQQLAMEDATTYPSFSNADTTGMGSGTAKADSFSKSPAPMKNVQENKVRLSEQEESITAGMAEDVVESKDFATITLESDDARAPVVAAETLSKPANVGSTVTDSDMYSGREEKVQTLSEVTVTKTNGKEKRKKDVAEKTASKNSLPASNYDAVADEGYVQNDSVYLFPEVLPAYPGGQVAMMEFFGRNLMFPDGTPNGVIYIEFVVQIDGSISNAIVKKGLIAAADAEALRVVNLMPKWTPGTMNGKPVITQMVIPVAHEQN